MSVPLFLCFATLVVTSSTNDLDVARQALRDGFWSLARTRACAQAPTCEEAKLIVLESWASEEKWDEVLHALKAWGDPTGDVFCYYRALAWAKKGDVTAAQSILQAANLNDPVYVRLAVRLQAEMALAQGYVDSALEKLSSLSGTQADEKILLAEVRSRRGEIVAARALWRDVLADTNAPPSIAVTAAVNLGDENALREIVSNTTSSAIQSLARLRLGSLLLASPTKFADGAEMIRNVVAESPDLEGALEASRLLAAAYLRRQDWAGAATAYAEILEIWPTAARLESVQEGLGWALFKQGRAEEAFLAFSRAEACATTDDDRAVAGAKVADTLVALGRMDEAMAKYREIMTRYSQLSISQQLNDLIQLRELETKGRDLYSQFRFAEAQKVFQAVAAGDESRRGRMEFFEILCLYGQAKDEEAESRARNLAQNADDLQLRLDATRWLARAAYNGGRWREARELFGRLAASSLTSPTEVADARVWAARAALAANDFSAAISSAAEVVGASVSGAVQAEALIVQGEALLELARFDEAVLVFERAALVPDASASIRLEAQIFRADAFYAMGADNSARYEEALAAYRAIDLSESVSEESRMTLAYKIGLTLEKLKRKDEAMEQYYTSVVLAYRTARQAGHVMDEEARAVFARAAFRLADLCESGGRYSQARKTLELVVESNVPAATEARKRIDRLDKKGILP